MPFIKLRFKMTEPLIETCRGRGGHGIRLLPLDPGSGRKRRTSPETAILLPSPAVGAEVDLQADPQPFFPTRSPCSHPALSRLLPLRLLLSLSLPACTGAVYRTGPQWPWVINGH